MGTEAREDVEREVPGRRDSGEAGDRTRLLLRLGVLAGPFYLILGLAQAYVRDGFDPARHPLSVLVHGSGGWVQTANFVLAGLMVIAAAVGFRRVLGAWSRSVSWPLGLYGVSMLVAAAFPADPLDGFPPGTPAGFPESFSTSGLVHFAAGGLGFTCLAVSCLAAAAALSHRGARGLAWVSGASGVLALLGFFAGPAIAPVAPATLGIWVTVVVGWTWLSVVSARLQSLSPDRAATLPRRPRDVSTSG